MWWRREALIDYEYKGGALEKRDSKSVALTLVSMLLGPFTCSTSPSFDMRRSL